MAEDLYHRLGVAPDATKQEIRAAWLGIAKVHHPDRGGDRETYEAAHAAYDLLMDDQKRQRYDVTGDTGSGPTLDQEEIRQKAIEQNAVAYFLRVLEQTQDFRLQNVVEATAMMLDHEADSAEENLQALRANYANIQDATARISVKTDGTENFLAAHLRRMGEATMEQEKNFLSEIEMKRDVARYLRENFDYRIDHRQTVVMHNGYGSTNSTSSTMGWSPMG